jgi:hypothetical protein
MHSADSFFTFTMESFILNVSWILEPLHNFRKRLNYSPGRSLLRTPVLTEFFCFQSVLQNGEHLVLSFRVGEVPNHYLLHCGTVISGPVIKLVYYLKTRIIGRGLFSLSITWQHRDPQSNSRVRSCHFPHTSSGRHRNMAPITSHGGASREASVWPCDNMRLNRNYLWQKTIGYRVAAKLYLNVLIGSRSRPTSWETVLCTAPQTANILIPNFLFSNIQLHVLERALFQNSNYAHIKSINNGRP